MKKDRSNHSNSLSYRCKDTKILKPDHIIIKSKGKEYVCLIDPEDYELISRYNWSLHNQGYAVTTVCGLTILMHRLIMGVINPEIQVDHIYHNKLDNRKANIRLCTRSENRRNSRKLEQATSILKGIYRDGKYWHVQIVQDSKVKNLGRYLNEYTAAKVYDHFARKLYKEFALLNFPDFVMPIQLVIPDFSWNT